MCPSRGMNEVIPAGSSLVSEDQIRGQAKTVHVPAAADQAELADQPRLYRLAELVAQAQRHRQIAVPGDVHRAEVEQIIPLEIDRPLRAVEGVACPIHLNQRVPLVLVKD